MVEVSVDTRGLAKDECLYKLIATVEFSKQVRRKRVFIASKRFDFRSPDEKFAILMEGRVHQWKFKNLVAPEATQARVATFSYYPAENCNESAGTFRLIR